MSEQVKLDKEEFRKWLEGYGDGRCGVRGGICNCPIAKFLAENYVTGNVQVFHAVWSRGAYSLVEELPEWAVRFIQKVDRGRSKHVKGTECLTILKEIEA